MRKRLHSILPWLIGIIAATLLFLVLSRITYFRYENSDDILMVKGFMGFQGGTPQNLNLYTNTLLAHALSLLAPSVPWFSVFQLFLLWCGCVTLMSGFYRLATGHGNGHLPGVGVGIVFWGMFAFFACCRLTYTTTAALVSAAALVHLLTLGLGKPSASSVLLRSLVSVFLLVCAYSLRDSSILPALPFCGLAVFAMAHDRNRTSGEKHNARLFWIPVFSIAISIVCLFGVRYWETSQPETTEAFQWQSARIDLFDYTAFEQDLTPALRVAESAGISPSELSLIQQWYFMDENITAEALQKLRAAYPQADIPQRMAHALQTMSRFFSQDPRYMLAAILLLALCLLNLLCHSKGQSIVLPVISLLGMISTAALLLYLAYQGRFLSRAVDTVLFPAAALQCGLFLMSARSFHAKAVPMRIAIAFLCMVCLGVACTHVAFTKRVISDHPDAVSLQREDDLERYALENPEKLIVRTPNLLRDTRLFPDVSAGLPTNIIIWGDWYCRMPGWYAQLQQHGIDGKSFTAKDWLHPNVLFATAQGYAPPDALIAHISEETQGTVRSLKVGEEGTLCFFRFTLSN